MRRISLPGKEKHKKIILLILVLISVIILIFEFKNNQSNNTSIKSNEQEYISGAYEHQGYSNDSIVKNEDNFNNISERETELYNSAYTTFFSGNYEEAVRIGDKLIKEFPNSYMGYNKRGIAEAYNGDFNSAMSDIDKSLSIKSDYGYGRFNKALTYELYGQFDDALLWYNKALEIEDYVWSYYGIASIYGRRGDVKNTIE